MHLNRGTPPRRLFLVAVPRSCVFAPLYFSLPSFRILSAFRCHGCHAWPPSGCINSRTSTPEVPSGPSTSGHINLPEKIIGWAGLPAPAFFFVPLLFAYGFVNVCRRPTCSQAKDEASVTFSTISPFSPLGWMNYFFEFSLLDLVPLVRRFHNSPFETPSYF